MTRVAAGAPLDLRYTEGGKKSHRCSEKNTHTQVNLPHGFCCTFLLPSVHERDTIRKQEG